MEDTEQKEKRFLILIFSIKPIARHFNAGLLVLNYYSNTMVWELVQHFYLPPARWHQPGAMQER